MHDVEEFPNAELSVVFVMPKFVPKYTMLDCVEGNDPARKAVGLAETLETVAESK